MNAHPRWFLHGFTGSGADWLPLRSLLDDGSGWAPDLIPRGGEERLLPFDSLAVAAAALATRTNGPVDVLGYSMGGRLALTFAVRHPERVRRLVLVGASPGIVDEEQREARAAWDEEIACRIERDGAEQFADFWESLPILASQSRIDPSALSDLRARRRARDTTALAACMRGWGTGRMTPLHAGLSRVAAPVLLVVGAEDAKYRAIADEMRDALPRAELHIIPGTGHTAHLERPEVVAPRLDAFLA